MGEEGERRDLQEQNNEVQMPVLGCGMKCRLAVESLDRNSRAGEFMHESERASERARESVET